MLIMEDLVISRFWLTKESTAQARLSLSDMGVSSEETRYFSPLNKQTGLLIFRGKKSKISRDYQGQIRGKSAHFAGFSREKVNFRKIFRGKFLGKSADFTGNFGGKLRQETISKKQPISLDFFWQISLKSINFASI